MKRKIITTSDGSKTIQIEDWDEQYHSKHGAIQEAYHVFIKHGLSLFNDREISLMEIGFGTGLNTFITYLESKKNRLSVNYVGIEKYPVKETEWSQLGYIEALEAEDSVLIFNKIHTTPWEEKNIISSDFSLTKRQQDFMQIDDKNTFDLIYFDAFGARVQPELWTETIFKIMYNALKTDGILVTYSAKGSVRRAMQAVGFTVERLPGPPGKREMLLARKI